MIRNLLHRYADVVSKLLSEDFGYLLVSIERQFEQPNMMPHSVSFDDAQAFFGESSGFEALTSC